MLSDHPVYATLPTPGFRVNTIETEVAALRERSVVFEDYESPKTVDGIATDPDRSGGLVQGPGRQSHRHARVRE
jgi:hypothetical protein